MSHHGETCDHSEKNILVGKREVLIIFCNLLSKPFIIHLTLTFD